MTGALLLLLPPALIAGGARCAARVARGGPVPACAPGDGVPEAAYPR